MFRELMKSKRNVNNGVFCGPQIVHGDLAARNVLVFPDGIVKVADFGMSRQLYGRSQYKREKPVGVSQNFFYLLDTVLADFIITTLCCPRGSFHGNGHHLSF